MKEDDLKDVYQDNFLDVDATITEMLNKTSAGDVNVLLPLYNHECHCTYTIMLF